MARLQKKGVIEVQFNWIFILIAGAVILLFFGYLVVKLRGTAEEKTSTTVLSNLETILTSAGVSTGTLNVVKLPDAEIEISCERFAIGPLIRPIDSDVVFAPRMIKGRELLTFTLEWATPFRVTNFLYLTSPNVRYILVFDCGSDASDNCQSDSYKLMSKINNTLPEELNKDLRQTSVGPSSKFKNYDDITDLNNYEVRFVFFGIDPITPLPPAFNKMNNKDVTALKINPGTPADTYLEGPVTITFYQKSGSNWGAGATSTSLRKSSVIGAVFSNDLEDYECNMEKAFRRLVHVSEVYKKRSKQLDTGPANCRNYHLTEAQTQLDVLKTQATSGFPADTSAMSSAIVSLGHLNNLAELSSCVLIY